MAGKPALYAAGVTCLSFVSLALAATAVGLPIWGYFDNPIGGWESDHGYFGPFQVCRQLTYGREKCGIDVSRFRPTKAIYISGILATLCCIFLALFSIFSIIQIAMISSREKVVMKYGVLVVFKLIFSILAAILAIVAASLFAIETDLMRTGFMITRGVSFYLQILTIILTLGLLGMAIYDVLQSRREGGDPTFVEHPLPGSGTTFNNPGFREGRRTGGISMTDASGKPYGSGSQGSATNGSMQSMNTTLTSMSNGSTVDSVTRSPLRSSLKKPKPKDGLGIQNPGFSGSGQSPTMGRNGSMKKVRIQTHSTEV
ncbi:uncharacterized protein LOC132264663 [Phlebotomus argentipes]|uniref:uncharacterized protein LOC132264663 n=1 Tax=Phlebotomus argentipes TaxID=94469 RepID=UPI002892A6BB|nr:uncharacterized protein LOC132264663 [Phlebotomus argentipes]